MLSLVDTRNHVLDGGSDRPWEVGNFEGKGMPRHLRRHSAVSCAKTVEPIEMPFGLWTGIGARKHVLDGVQIPHAKEQFLGNGHARACRRHCRELCNKSSAVALMGDRLGKIHMGRKVGGAAVRLCVGKAGFRSNTMSPGLRPTSVPSGILIHPAV